MKMIRCNKCKAIKPEEEVHSVLEQKEIPFMGTKKSTIMMCDKCIAETQE